MTTNVRDPRSIVTPDAYSVSDGLLGLPLASPRRRLVAILIDLMVVAWLTAITQDVGIFIWGIIGAILLRLAIRPRRAESQLGQVTSAVFRTSTGCLGSFMLLIVVIVAVSNLIDDDSVEDAARGLADAMAEAEATAEGEEDELASILDTLSEAHAVRTLAVLRGEDAAELAAGEAVADDPPSPEAGDEPPEMVEPTPGFSIERTEWMRALQVRTGELLAADRIDSLSSALDRAERRSSRLESELEVAEARASSGLSGLAALGSDLVSQLGSAFGVWSLYFTVSLVLLKGRTAGKLLTRMRVLRLDGEPFTWWSALERSGGYAAGLATGLLGFVQIFWDRNRQCVHDKIVGTVVVMDGIAAEPGAWQEAWDGAEPEEQ